MRAAQRITVHNVLEAELELLLEFWFSIFHSPENAFYFLHPHPQPNWNHQHGRYSRFVFHPMLRMQ